LPVAGVPFFLLAPAADVEQIDFRRGKAGTPLQSASQQRVPFIVSSNFSLNL